MVACSAPNCTNSSGPFQKAGVTFHRFPLDVTLRDKWVQAINRSNWIPKSFSVLCSAHFRFIDFERVGRSCVRLRDGSIPTLFNSSSAPNLNFKRKAPQAAALKKAIGYAFEAVIEPELKNKDVFTVNDLVEKLIAKKVIPLSLGDLLLERFGGMLMSEVARNSGRGGATAREREFAMALYCHSRLGYNAVRALWWLPTEAVIVGNFLAASRFQPGISRDTMSAIAAHVEACCVLKDAALQLTTVQLNGERQWGAEGPCGEVDLGGAACLDSEELSTQALIIHLAAVTGPGGIPAPGPSFSSPIGYFFLPPQGCHQFIANVIRGIIYRMHLIGVSIHAVTVPSMDEWADVFRLLGCQFGGTLSSYFYDDLSQHSIFVFFDHRRLVSKWVKIMADEKSRLEMPSGSADIKFIQRLVERVREIEAAYRVDNAQRCYLGRLLVRLKYHLLSSEVADALEFLRASRDADFFFSSATIEVLRLVDAVGQCLGVGDSRPAVTRKTMSVWTELLDDITSRLNNDVRVDGLQGLLHTNKAFLVGFLANLTSLRSLASRFVVTKSKLRMVPAAFTLERAEEFAARARFFAKQTDADKPPSAAELTKALVRAYYHPSGCLHATPPNYYPVAPSPVLTICHKYRAEVGVKVLDDSDMLVKARIATERLLSASLAVQALIDDDATDPLVDVLVRSELRCCDCVTALFNEHDGPAASVSLRLLVREIRLASKARNLPPSSPIIVNAILQDFVDRPLFKGHTAQHDAPIEELHSIQLVRLTSSVLNELIA